jgi:hypothetical protein
MLGPRHLRLRDHMFTEAALPNLLQLRRRKAAQFSEKISSGHRQGVIVGRIDEV